MNKLVERFLLSATSPEQFPEETVPEIAFLGRSNVGKSSLINALLGRKAARVSSSPGRTRAINFFSLHEDESRPAILIFADLPGYGYAKVSKSISAEWPTFIEPYLESRTTLAMCVCLVDTNIPPQPPDAQLIEWLKAHQRSFLVVGTKADRISGNTLTNSLRALREELGVETILPCSAEKNRGIRELWKELRSVAD